MKNFHYVNPVPVRFGSKALERIGRQLARRGADRVVLVCGRESARRNGAWDRCAASLDRAGLAWMAFQGVKPEPELAVARDLVALLREHRADALVALGGGSVIDVAKVAAAATQLDDPWALFTAQEEVRRSLPLVAAPTLSGSGSECNCSAILRNAATRSKWGIKGPALFPVAACIDPGLQAGLPWELTARGALDALAHLIEHHVVGTDQEVTLALNESLQRTIILCTERLRPGLEDPAARASLVWAASLALGGLPAAGLGRGDWTVHCLAHSVGALFPTIAHAQAVAALLPAWIRLVSPSRPAIFTRWARAVWNCEDLAAGLAAFVDLLKTWALPTRLSELGLSADDADELAANVELFARQHGRPGLLRPLSPEAVRSLFLQAL